MVAEVYETIPPRKTGPEDSGHFAIDVAREAADRAFGGEGGKRKNVRRQRKRWGTLDKDAFLRV